MQPITHWTITVVHDGGAGWRATAVDAPLVGAWGATHDAAVERLRRLLASIEHVGPEALTLVEGAACQAPAT